MTEHSISMPQAVVIQLCNHDINYMLFKGQAKITDKTTNLARRDVNNPSGKPQQEHTNDLSKSVRSDRFSLAPLSAKSGIVA
eukprot:7901026-Pyramimonas_sp.AAC.2